MILCEYLACNGRLAWHGTLPSYHSLVVWLGMDRAKLAYLIRLAWHGTFPTYHALVVWLGMDGPCQLHMPWSFGLAWNLANRRLAWHGPCQPSMPWSFGLAWTLPTY